jgi:uncharacterized repeat protein (TIGR03803 family)
MQSQAQRLISFFRTIVLPAVIAFLITSAALPMSAQNSVPATAAQAARMPRFAARLAHPATPPMPRRHLPQGNNAYDNGPVNGQVDAWTINFGFSTTDTIQVSGGASPTGLNFWAWLIPGDTISNVQVSIGSTPFGSDLFNGVVNLTQSDCFSNDFGYNVCQESSNITNGPMLNGNAWVTLQNANVPSGDPVYWDENSGVGCQSPGCPSEAQENTVGTIPSEAFTMVGSVSTCPSPAEEKRATEAKAVTVPPSPTQSYRVIYNFTGAVDGGSPLTGLVIDAAGNLYGTTDGGGPFGGGTVFQLTPSGSGWRFTRLYAFSGANGSEPDSTLVLGADGRPYGTTLFGGVVGVGVLFGLAPPEQILPSVFSNWMETLLYSFTGGSDGARPGGSLVLDSSGNIYGNAAMGGANRGGTFYEFTNGGIQVLHAFPAFPNDGRNPIGVASGSNGLYGITGSGGEYGAGTLYTTAGGYQVLHNFMPNGPDGNPTSLTADQAGNLYGAANYVSYVCLGPGGYEPVGNAQVFTLSPPDWNPFIVGSLQQFFTSLSSRVSTDTLGNIYGTTDYYGNNLLGNVFKLTCCWNYSDLHDFAGGPNDGANPEASPVVDAQGNIYGTTQNGGAYGLGVVWEISP